MRLERRIEALKQELTDLPEYTPEAYMRWLKIQEALTGLYDIKRCFLDSPKSDKPLTCFDELLY